MLRLFLSFLTFVSVATSAEGVVRKYDYVLTEEEKSQIEEILSINPQDIYDKAINYIKEEDYYSAIKELNDLELYYSHSSFYFKARLLLPYVYMLAKQYPLAISSINVFLSLYPDYKDIDFVYYLRGEIYYRYATKKSFEGIKSSTKNINIGSSYLNALKFFSELIDNYPDSKYVPIASEKIKQIKNIIVSSKLSLVRFLQRDRKSIAAMKILHSLSESYSDSEFMPEILYRIIEIYYYWGLDSEVQVISDLMHSKYPDSFWTNNVLAKFLHNHDIPEKNRKSVEVELTAK